MTARWPTVIWLVPALVALGLILALSVRPAGQTSLALPAPGVALTTPCDSCAARYQRIGRIALARQSGELP
ncbi:MAG: hypothetical protein NTW20_17660 [Rhodobacterales bacterium]|nr:hypothetical protein [Rhodobacterales bacterium]